MPLINLVTDLKSLKYGKDTPGGGNSGQPYIQSKIPDGLLPRSPDFLLRNGFLAPVDALEDIRRLGKMFGDLKSPNGLLFIAKQNILSNSAVRTQAGGTLNNGVYTPLSTLAQAGLVAFGGHLNKQGIDPTGLSPLSLRTYLDVVNPTLGAALSLKSINNNRLVRLAKAKIKGNYIGNVGISLVDNSISSLSDNILTYRGGPGSVLGVGFTNIGFADQRTGLNNPLLETDPDYFYGRNTKQFIPGNYLKTLGAITRAGIIIPLPLDNTGVSGKYVRLTNTRLVNAFNDQGKPVGDYAHNVYEPAVEGNTWPKNTPLINANNTFTYNQEDIIQSNVNPPSGNHLSPQIQDFRKVLRNRLGETSPEGKKATNLGATPIAPDYQTKNMAVRVNIGDPGQRANKSYASYSTGVINEADPDPNRSFYGNFSDGTPKGLDQITSLPIYRSEVVDTELPVNDLVKFRIAAIDGSNPEFKTFMHFRAFIDSFSDSYSADWGSVRYLGRGEKFYNYNGFDRTISLSFTVAAQSKPELIPMYKKLNYLASNLTPDYSPFGYMRGPLVQLTMGGYLYEQVGFITALTYDIPNDTTWEIGLSDTAGDPTISSTAGLDNLKSISDSSVKELPHRINVSSFQFTPIHNFRPGKQGLGFNGLALGDSSDGSTGFVTTYGPQRYIALEAINNNYDN
jgi:hypothetical protein